MPRAPKPAPVERASVEARGPTWYGRVNLGGGRRPWVPLGPTAGPGALSEARASEKLRALVETGKANGNLEALVARLRERMAPRRRSTHAPRVGGVETVRKLGAAWTSGELLETYGRKYGLKKKKNPEIDRQRLERCYALQTRGPRGPAFGDLAVVDVTEQDVEIVLSKAPRADARAATIVQYYALLSRLFGLAERPCRLRPRNSSPVDRGMRPEKDDGKIFSYLYPRELLAVLALPGIPLARKIFYVLACYVGLRKGTLLALRWRDVNLKDGTLTALVVKNGEPQSIPLYFDGLRWTLERWHEVSGEPDGDELVLGQAKGKGRGIGCEVGREAETLRADLRAAGVTRRELFVDDDPKIEPLRAHDMRATLVSWARRAGMSEGWIVDRTGHLDAKMVARYARAARSLADLQIVPFPELRGAIPELSTSVSTPPRNGDLGSGGSSGSRQTKPQNRGRRARRARSGSSGVTPVEVQVLCFAPTGKQGQSASAAGEGDGPPKAEVDSEVDRAPAASPFAGVSDADLGAALVKATLSGNGASAELIATELRRRERARAGNVVDLGERRRG